MSSENKIDKEAIKKIAQVMWFVDQSCQSEHPTQMHLDSAEEVLKIFKILGYHKPQDRPKLKEKIGNILQLICWNLVSDNINCSGVECNEGKGSSELCPGLKEHQEQILALVPEPSEDKLCVGKLPNDISSHHL